MKRMKRFKPDFKFFPLIEQDIEEGVYSFSTKNWTRIWFTTNPEQFIPKKNKEKIIDFLDKFASRKISLIYDSRLLDTKGKEDLSNFQRELSILNKSHQINFYDFSEHGFQEKLLDANELTLYGLANVELQNLSNGGNVAAASDIIRTLSVLYRLGIYTDFDVEFLNSTLEEFKTSSPFLCSVSGNARCNDVLAIHPEAPKTDLLNKYYSNIKWSYRLCKEYNSEERNQLKLEMAFNFMSLFQDGDRELIEEALDILFYIMGNKYEEFDSLPMILLIRKACEEAIKNDEKGNLKKIYRKIYMNNVMSSAGPSALPSMSYSEEGDCKKLQQLVRGQVDLVANDCGWIPPILDNDKTQRPEEKNEQENANFRRLSP